MLDRFSVLLELESLAATLIVTACVPVLAVLSLVVALSLTADTVSLETLFIVTVAGATELTPS